MARKYTTEFFIERAKEKHDNYYDYAQVNYLGDKAKVKIKCPIHGLFEQSPGKHITGQGCKKCGDIKRGEQSTSNIKIFIDRARKIHGDKYDYSKSIYSKARFKITIICPFHGEFQQVAHSHLIGMGCDKCGREIQHRKHNSNTEEFVIKAQKKHGREYDYSLAIYSKARKKVKIVCNQHGEFEQTPDSHIRGQGCPQCGDLKIGDSLRSDIETFIKRAQKIHRDKYDYSLVVYTTARKHVEIICKEHGIFQQIPDVHLNRDGGCSRCSDRWKSQNEWLTAMGIPDKQSYRQVRIKLDNDRYIIADGYEPKTKTIYEYWGSYYHGHPDYYHPEGISYMGHTFGELYKKTREKIEMIKTSGYNLVEIWEHEYKPDRFKVTNV